ncbi:MAG: family intrarane metalloprotease [Bradyrhizobium sp.]|nr:family intrarane metalloprotease [Bradyrhizobium sp.]
MPIEPVTPDGSTTWRVVHFPVVLLVIATIAIVAAGLSVKLFGLGLRYFTYVPGARYLGPLAAAAAIFIVYRLFVRVVERRPDVEELGTGGLRELALGFGIGAAWSLAIFAVLLLIGGVRIVGFLPPHALLLTIVVQLCASVILEIVLRGMLFRQLERLFGTWLALLLVTICFGFVSLSGANEEPLAVLANAIDAGLVFSAMFIVTRRLWATIGLHIAWFFAQIGLNGVPSIAGGPREFVLTQTAGPEWLTGGHAGTYASVPALVISGMLVATLLAVAVRRRQVVRPSWRRGRPA